MLFTFIHLVDAVLYVTVNLLKGPNGGRYQDSKIPEGVDTHT